METDILPRGHHLPQAAFAARRLPESFMSEGHERGPTHSLGELLVDNTDASQKVKEAAKSAPFVIIALMATAQR